MIRLAALYSHPIQYVAPMLRTLAAYPGVDLTVYFCSRQGVDVTYDREFGHSFQWDVPLLEGYQSRFLPNLRQGTEVTGFFHLINPDIVTELWRKRYDAILVHGYEHSTKWLAFLTAKLAGTRIILRGESNLLRHRPWTVRMSKHLLLNPLMHWVSACAFIGQNNREYYLHHGAAEDKLYFAPYVVDNEFFQEQATLFRSRRQSIRQRLGLPSNSPVILACGKLIGKKQPLLLLRAFQLVRQQMQCALLYTGDGELRTDIETCVRSEHIPNVSITGFVNQSQIGEVYVAADIFVMPSANEPWGLAVNEAMNFSLPIVASDQVGCARDLVRPRENGLVVKHDDVGGLRDALLELVNNAEQRTAFGNRSLEIIQSYTLGRSAAGIVAAAQPGDGA